MKKARQRDGSVSTDQCVCPKCGYKTVHVKGNPCTETRCPKCGSYMKGDYCK